MKFGDTFSYFKLVLIGLMMGVLWCLLHLFVLRDFSIFTFIESGLLAIVAFFLLAYTRRKVVQSNENLENVLKQLPTGVIIAEAPTGKLLMKNHLAEEILKKPFQPAERYQDYSLYYEGYHSDGRAYKSEEWPLARTILTGEVVHGEEITFYDEKRLPYIVKVNTTPIYDCHKNVIAAVASFYDITEMKTAEKLLNEALHKYRDLIDTIDGIVWEANPEFNFTFVSKEAERLTGFTREEWMQNGFWTAHIHPEDKEEAITFCIEQTAKAIPHDFEYRFITKDNQIIWLRDLVTVVMENGKFKGLRGIMVDITEKKKIEELFKQTQIRMRTILENEPEGIIILDREGRIQETNPGALVICGKKSGDDLLTKKFSDLVSDPYKDLFFEMTAKVARGEKSRLEFELKEPKCWVDVQSVPLPDNLILMVARDATEKKQLDLARDELLSKAEKSIQMRDDFLSVASHELKTPLTPIKLEIQLVKQYLQFANKDIVPKFDLIMKHLLDADKQFDRFLKLVANLLDVSLISADRLILEREKVDLSRLIEEVCQSFAREYEINGVTLSTHIENNIVGSFDKIRIEQVVVNLLSNALKYGSGKPVELSLQKEKDKINLSVKDQGIGIAKDDQKKLFEKFERIAPVKNYPGMGLGLYISNNIVKAHHGRIKVESEPKHGTNFIVEIPLNKTGV